MATPQETAVLAHKCIECERTVDDNAFQDQLSYFEWRVSGICGPCQRRAINYENRSS